MTFIRSLVAASAATVFTGVSLAGCGGSGGGGGGGAAASGSDDEQIRTVAKTLERLRPPGDAKRICELLSSRAEAQFAGVAGASPGASCVSVVAAGSPGLTLSARQIDRAKLTVRADRALLVTNEGRLGMRKVDGDWLVDDLLVATLDGPVRPSDRALTDGSDEEQVRAVLAAAGKATADHDDARMCGLMGAGAEAQMIAGALVTGLSSGGGTKQRVDVRSCAQALARIRRFGRGDGEVPAVLAKLGSSSSEVAIRDGRARVSDSSGDEALLVREEGRWLLAPDGDAFGGGGP